MPAVSRAFLRASVVWLLLGSLLGIWVALGAAAPLFLPGLGPVYIHFWTVGWATQLIFGVMHWMFPRQSPDRPRGRVGLAWAAFVLLNLGLLWRAVGEPALAWGTASWAGAMVITAAVSQWAGVAAFVVHIWPRIRER